MKQVSDLANEYIQEYERDYDNDSPQWRWLFVFALILLIVVLAVRGVRSAAGQTGGGFACGTSEWDGPLFRSFADYPTVVPVIRQEHGDIDPMAFFDVETEQLSEQSWRFYLANMFPLFDKNLRTTGEVAYLDRSDDYQWIEFISFGDENYSTETYQDYPMLWVAKSTGDGEMAAPKFMPDGITPALIVTSFCDFSQADDGYPHPDFVTLVPEADFYALLGRNTVAFEEWEVSADYDPSQYQVISPIIYWKW